MQTQNDTYKFLIKYTIPSFPINGGPYKSNSLKGIVIDLNVLANRLRHYIKTFIEKGNDYNLETLKWNLFEQMGIPSGSYINESESEIRLKRFTRAVRILFQTLNYYNPLIDFLDKKKIDYRFLMSGHQFQVFWNTSLFNPSFDNLESIDTGVSILEVYKIHLTPKADYAVYTILKLFTILGKDNYKSVFEKKKITGKILLNFRTSLPTEENTSLTSVNGGATPMIVLYMNNDIEFIKQVLNILLIEFEPDIQEIGAMIPQYRYRILPFNIRLNSLISYSQGDRCFKLDAREAFKKKKKAKEYFIPTWVKNILQPKCSIQEDPPNNEMISMQIFGKNICKAEEDYFNENCLDDICWITAYPDTFLNPMDLEQFRIESENLRFLEEADTTANNDQAIGAGAGAGAEVQQLCDLPPRNTAGGRRKKQTRKRKQLRKRTRKYLRK